MALGSGWTTRDFERFWSKVDKSGECWMWKGTLTPKGYGAFCVGPRATHQIFRAHRVSWVLANGRLIPDGLVVRHSCDVPGCVNPSHLLLGTVADNNADIKTRGRGAVGRRNGAYTRPERVRKGEMIGQARLTAAAVSEARRRYAAGGITYKELALERGVSLTTMHRAVTGQTWAHVSSEKVAS